ncbi:hypothetical protein [Novosphingobium sp. Gsoil 351]|uniref:hypothetical protein n=1 Tax=Novosphingobium sp. Gsoil 351 TaxID=2675225 RepID=UPI0012B476CA|nr:hypothetical protein [Novosphingobium sp. Gsoil 351]QGN55131.1 hypothetical protein GKE62_11805 [Novosphingobium sp. Gsoil 351]
MSITPEELAAFADGELDGGRGDRVAAAAAADPALAAKIAAHRKLKARLSAHFAPILDEPVPAMLTAKLSPKAEVVDLAAARAVRGERRRLPRWSWIAAPALAASLALALFAPRGGERADYASGQLASALDNQLVATAPSDAPTRILLSFRDDAGAYCRAFSAARQSGIACRDTQGWKLRELRAGQAAQSQEYRQAGSSDAGLLEAAQAMAAGPAFDAAQELEARERGWR